MTEERMIRVISWQLCPNRLYDDRTERICKLTNNPCGLEYLNSRCPLEPAPPKDWAQQMKDLEEKMKDLEERNIRLSRFIMDWLGRELDIFPEGALSLDDILPTVTKLGGK